MSLILLYPPPKAESQLLLLFCLVLPTMASFREYKKAVKKNFELVDEQINITCKLYELNLTLTQQTTICEQLQKTDNNCEVNFQCSNEERSKEYEDLLTKLLTVRVELKKNLQIKDQFVNKLYNKRMKREIRLNIRNFYDSVASRTRNHHKTQELYNRNFITILKISKGTHTVRYFPQNF
jgi:hypothetical protein